MDTLWDGSAGVLSGGLGGGTVNQPPSTASRKSRRSISKREEEAGVAELI
jgi:hypothetical protein